MALIDVRGLERTFVVRRKSGRMTRERREVHAVHDLDFQVEAGEMVGYIGPNGAGKSTTIKMLTGILVPTGGHLRVAGLEPSRRRTELARRIGVVFGQRTTLWWDLPLRDSFELLQKIYRIPDDRYRTNLTDFVELLDLADLLDTPVRQLSLGQRMRGDIAASLLHDPEILYLDEPTIGLDVVSKGRLREFLRALNEARGTTLLLTTHDLQDIEALCRRVIVIDHGTAVFDGRAGRPAPAGRIDQDARRRPRRRGAADPGSRGRDPPRGGSATVAQLPERRQRGADRGRGGRGVRRRRPVDPGTRDRGRHPRPVLALNPSRRTNLSIPVADHRAPRHHPGSAPTSMILQLSATFLQAVGA